MLYSQFIIVAFKKNRLRLLLCSEIWKCGIYITGCQNGIGLLRLTFEDTAGVSGGTEGFLLCSPHSSHNGLLYSLNTSAFTLFQRLLTPLSGKFLGIQILL